MGRTKEFMMENEQNEDLVDFLKQLLEQDELSGAVEGISKQIIAKGVDSMSDLQKSTIEKFVEDFKKKNECERCGTGNIGSLSDYIFLSENDLCPTCDYDREKFMKD